MDATTDLRWVHEPASWYGGVVVSVGVLVDAGEDGVHAYRFGVVDHAEDHP